jgi:hypothetical protein
MIDRYCEVCKGYNAEDNHVIEIKDDKDKVIINCHQSCADELHSKIKNVKDLHKKSVGKVLKEIGFVVE